MSRGSGNTLVFIIIRSSGSRVCVVTFILKALGVLTDSSQEELVLMAFLQEEHRAAGKSKSKKKKPYP